MKKHLFGTLAVALIAAGACDDNNQEAKKLKAQAIEIHDEIMPQISVFDKQDILIDSLLLSLSALKDQDPNLDTAETKENLQALKANLESATDKMMVWMKEYTADSTDIAYQQSEIVRISELKSEFDQVKYEAERLLTPFK